MAVTVFAYSHFPTNLLNALYVGLGGEAHIKCMLLLDTYTPNQDDHNDVADVRGDEHAAAGNYATNGDTLTTTTVSVAARVTTYDTDNASWAASTITARYAVVYDDTEAADADKPLILCVDFGANKSSEAGTFEVAWNASGLFTITVAAEA